MNKSLVVALIASLALVACSRENKTTEETTTEQQTETTAPADQTGHDHHSSATDKVEHAAEGIRQDVNNMASDVNQKVDSLTHDHGTNTTTTTTTTHETAPAAPEAPAQD